ncbi:quinone oxidoreductase family protein [Chitinophaga sp. 22321]|uniref:Zinc-binding dehydrogenase n=1 Tax=Chitinophaga hostae TaxID=2831022 RepID=A0ABS5J648_9BACT|nr:zinc-binding dehydrogenase [Chitinophaga hostae]MBS0030698.1 zinc-binding dehydrogenase [Chitinophaga hostae]
MQAITFNRIGAPEEVLQLSEVSIPAIKDNEVLIRTTAASINPGDFLFIQNLYPEPKKPVFPLQIAGNHGSGIIEKVGKDVSLQPGSHAAFSYYNTWAEYVAVPAEWLIPLPAEYPAELGSQFVNLITAWDLLKQSGVKPGQWLVLTAGNAAVSKLVAQLAKQQGIPVISIVRSVKQAQLLESLGATVVIDLSVERENVTQRIMEISGNKGVKGIIDNVGGPVTGELLRCVDFDSKLIINGGMSAEKYTLHNFDVLLKGLQIQSHVYRYFFTPPLPEDVATLKEIAAISANFASNVSGIHALEDFKTAIEESIRFPEKGKQIFKM